MQPLAAVLWCFATAWLISGGEQPPRHLMSCKERRNVHTRCLHPCILSRELETERRNTGHRSSNGLGSGPWILLNPWVCHIFLSQNSCAQNGARTKGPRGRRCCRWRLCGLQCFKNRGVWQCRWWCDVVLLLCVSFVNVNRTCVSVCFLLVYKWIGVPFSNLIPIFIA